MTVDYTQSVKELLEQGLTTIPFPAERIIPGTIRCFKRLLREPELYRSQWTFDLRKDVPLDDQDGADDGYLRRNGELRKERYDDLKSIIHYRWFLPHLLRVRGVEIREHEYLLGYCRGIFTLAQRVAREFAAELDKALPGFRFEKRLAMLAAQEQSVLRIQSYDDTAGSKPIIGKGHTDLSLLTLHIADSRPGLRVGMDKTLVETIPGRAVVFAGYKMEKFTQGRIKALWHEVTDEPTYDVGERWSMVFFAHIVI